MTRRVSPDEASLWRRATRDAEPIRKRRGPLGVPIGETTREAATPVRSAVLKKGSQTATATHSRENRGGKAPPSAFEAGDPGLDRRVKRKSLAVERTLDLHGMTEARAHAALRSFLNSSYTEDLRLVLVITGKGGDSRKTDRRRGVIRARFLDWIDGPDLRPLIARASKAAQRHGGDGAFYVFLKARPERT